VNRHLDEPSSMGAVPKTDAEKSSIFSWLWSKKQQADKTDGSKAPQPPAFQPPKIPFSAAAPKSQSSYPGSGAPPSTMYRTLAPNQIPPGIQVPPGMQIATIPAGAPIPPGAVPLSAMTGAQGAASYQQLYGSYYPSGQ